MLSEIPQVKKAICRINILKEILIFKKSILKNCLKNKNIPPSFLKKKDTI